MMRILAALWIVGAVCFAIYLCRSPHVGNASLRRRLAVSAIWPAPVIIATGVLGICALLNIWNGGRGD